MFKATDFKKETSNDSYKNKIYLFDNYIQMAMEIYEEESSNPLFQIKDAALLTQNVLELEKIPNIKVSIKKSKTTSTCNPRKSEIKFSPSHSSNQEVALHELAHYFDALFGVIEMPGHHVGFLSAFEYLLNKYDFVHKNAIEKMATYFYEKTGVKIPYLKDFYQVSDISESEYNLLFKKLTAEEKVVKKIYSDHKMNLPEPLISKSTFDESDHYVNLIKIKDENNNGIRFIKVIVKKLGFEFKKDKKSEAQIVISPKFNMYKDYFGTIERTIKPEHTSYSGIAIQSPNKQIDADMLCDVLKLTKTLRELDTDLYSISINHKDTVFLGFDYYHFKKEDILSMISALRKELKKKRIHYYQSTSIKDFSLSCSGDKYFLY